MSHAHLPTSELPLRLLQFMKASVSWCMAESEASSQTILQAIESLLKKTERVASISNESLNALGKLKDTLSLHYADASKVTPVEHLVSTLESLSREHQEVGGVIGPIIEALQFQDRLRQNLETLVKLMTTWTEIRTKAGQQEFSRLEIGEELLRCTSMVEERDMIRKFFPELPTEDVIESQVAMF